jgi:hypothetical protein
MSRPPILLILLCLFLVCSLAVYRREGFTLGKNNNNDTTLDHKVYDMDFTGENGGMAHIILSPTGKTSVVILDKDGATATFVDGKLVSGYWTFTDALGDIATVYIIGSLYYIEVWDKSTGKTYTYKYLGSSSSPSFPSHHHHNSNTKTLVIPNIFYGPGQCTAQIVTVSMKSTVVVTLTNGRTIIFYSDTVFRPIDSAGEKHVFYGKLGGHATVYISPSGKYVIDVTTGNGHTYVYRSERSTQKSTAYTTIPPSIISKFHPIHKGGGGWHGGGIKPDDEQGGGGWDGGGIKPYSSQLSSSASSPSSASLSAAAPAFTSGGGGGGWDGGGGGSSFFPTITPSSIGIPKSMIPAGMEDLYILKSQAGPLDCPACSTTTIIHEDGNGKGGKDKCQPCPACARCPEPKTICKAVPNYNAYNDEFFPVPLGSPYSTVGM